MADELQIAVSVLVGLVSFVAALYFLFYRGNQRTDENEDNNAEETEASSLLKNAPVKTKIIPKKKAATNSSSSSSTKDGGLNHPLLIASLKGHTGSILSLDFSTNGKLLASCSEDRTVRLWHIKDFRERDHKYGRVNVEFDHASSISFSPDSRAFITSLATEQKLRVFKIQKEKKEGSNVSMTISPEFDFPKEHKADIMAVAISSNGKYIMSADKGTQVIIWTIKGDVLDKIDTLLMYNTYASISPCGNLVAACGFTSEVKLWYVHFTKAGDFQQVTKALEIKGHSAGVLSFSFTNDSKRIATASKDNTWKIWDINVNYLQGQEAYLLQTGHFAGYEDGIPVNIALSHDYFTVALTVGKHIMYYNSKSQELEDKIENSHPGNITSLRWYSDSKMLVSAGSTDRMVRVWENLVGAKANLVDLTEKIQKTTSANIKERAEQQISDLKEFIGKFEKK